MGLRFQKRIRVLPGVRVNVGLRGVSTSVGVRGASLTFGKRGTHRTPMSEPRAPAFHTESVSMDPPEAARPLAMATP